MELSPLAFILVPLILFSFEIIKDGNLLGKLPVRHKSFNLIGRLEDLCDIHVDNPLVSRKHAVLQAKRDDHHLYLMDLGSQHGTFVNKAKLPAHTYKKL
jgi:pSer/pThr/pTyr-binding forkhead associated (FHA) protein